jgi:hypothetical protein
MRTAKADQSLRTVLSSGQGAEVCAHVTQVAARRESRQFRGSRVFQTVFAVVGVIQTAHGLAILLDELTGARACCCSDVWMQRHADNRAAEAREESRPSGGLPRRSRSRGSSSMRKPLCTSSSRRAQSQNVSTSSATLEELRRGQQKASSFLSIDGKLLKPNAGEVAERLKAAVC